MQIREMVAKMVGYTYYYDPHTIQQMFLSRNDIGLMFYKRGEKNNKEKTFTCQIAAEARYRPS